MGPKTCIAIVKTCLNGRTSTVSRATEALLVLVEFDQGDKVMDALIKEGIVHKVPKVVPVALEIMAQVFK